MIDPHLQRLANQAVDGELSPEARAELDALLESSPEAREYYQALQQCVDVLENTPAVEPPEGLRSKILAGTALPAPRTRIGQQLFGWLGAVPQPAAMFLTFITGALLTAGVLGIATDSRLTVNPDQLMGTMASAERSALKKGSSRLPIAAKQVEGQATLSALDGLWIVSFALRTDEAVEVDLALDGRPMAFRGFTRAGEGASLTHESDSRITVATNGQSRFSVALQAPGSVPGARFTVAIRSNGQPLFSGALAAPQ